MIHLKYNSFHTDIGIQMMQTTERQQKKRIFVFAVHVTDLIPTYIFRAIPLTQRMLRLIMIALKKDLRSVSGNDTLDKNLFILELGQIIVQFHPSTGALSSYLV